MKRILTLLTALILPACNSTSNTISISELLEKSNGAYTINASCKSLNDGSGIISDGEAATRMYISKRCSSYGQMRVIKEGVGVRVLTFMPIEVFNEIAEIEGTEKLPTGVLGKTNTNYVWVDSNNDSNFIRQ